MQNRWDEAAAARCADELALRAYSSRLLGSDPALVLLGGGNTSLKLRDAKGEQLLYVKGTGVDLAQVTASDFTPLRLSPLRAMLQKNELGYASMMQELAAHTTVQSAPKPSIETLLHAALPAPYVEHTHADSVLAITNTDGGIALAEQVFGELALVVPYRHSGFALAKICAEAWAESATGNTIGMVLMHHGVVACGASARESYENMLRLVELAEAYLARHGVAPTPAPEAVPFDLAAALAMTDLRREISLAAGYPLLLTQLRDPVTTAFARSPAAVECARESPATPQHAVFARRLPMRGRDVAAFAADYDRYLQLLPDGADKLDAAPRIVLDEALGVLAAGITPWYMDAAATSYRHTIDTMLNAGLHDRYQGLPPRAVLEAELEYGGFERRIARKRTPGNALAGTVCLLAPSLADSLDPIAETLLAAGAAVVAFGPAESDGYADPAYFLAGAYDAANLTPALINAIARFGGIDTVICSAKDILLIEQALPWLQRSARDAGVVLVKASADEDTANLSDSLRAQNLTVTEINAAIYFSPLQLAQELARLIALPSIQDFPAHAP
jgi:rhamnose utilization protein RhaD (predicted bifunctional aldolase and dehydrogenase)